VSATPLVFWHRRLRNRPPSVTLPQSPAQILDLRFPISHSKREVHELRVAIGHGLAPQQDLRLSTISNDRFDREPVQWPAGVIANGDRLMVSFDTEAVVRLQIRLVLVEHDLGRTLALPHFSVRRLRDVSRPFDFEKPPLLPN
jgi:hypothetical protein